MMSLGWLAVFVATEKYTSPHGPNHTSMKRLAIQRQSLLVQIILAFVALVLFTAVAASLPAQWLIRDQQWRQAWAQVDQGSQATQALYLSKMNEVVGVATLTAERPTLHALLAQADAEAISAYLRTLQSSARVDGVLICDVEGQRVTQTGESLPASLCKAGAGEGFYVAPEERTQRVWLLAGRPIVSGGATQGLAIVGELLDRQFAEQMRTQTGLEHTLIVSDESVATSLDSGDTTGAVRREAIATQKEGVEGATFTLGGVPFFAAHRALSDMVPTYQPLSADQASPQVEIALAVTDMVSTQRRLARALAFGILAAVLMGSILGAFLARRISRPLARLADAAAALSGGTLDTSLAGETRVREVAQVAQALEDAGRDLQRTVAELRREKAWTDHLLEAIVEGIMTLDHQGRIVFFSAGAERITGWRRTEVIGCFCDQVFIVAETDEPFSRFLPAPGLRQKITVVLAEGRPHTLAVTGAKLLPPESGLARVALVFRDVSEEEAIHRLLGDFLANVAHEFRTPLSALAASIELLRDQAPDLSAAELQELLTSLHLGIIGLQTLVDNLLEGASIEVGRFRVYPRPTDLGRIIAEAAQVMQPLLDKRGQRLTLQLPPAMPAVRADTRRTERALINLLSNACKYGPDGAEVVVGATVDDGWVRVTVADQGPGVPPELWQDLFHRFRRSDPDSAEAQYGVGLGLSVVRAVIEAQGGSVGVENREVGGAVFWFTVPVVNDGEVVEQ